jgi:hypothetical protein
MTTDSESAGSKRSNRALWLGIGAFIVGLFIGLVILGWWLWPVQWANSYPENLRPAIQEDYLRMAIDSYTVNGDTALAQRRYNLLGEAGPWALSLIQEDPGTQSPAGIAALSQAGMPPIATESALSLEPTTAVEKKWEDFNPDSFARSTQVDNPWLPLKPGTRFVYEGTSVQDDGTTVPHRVEINVTDLTKEIGSVRSVVTWDLDYNDDELAEAELAFYAQDDEGNVWRMGEYPEEYDAGEFVAAPTWIHGFQEARAGIMMKANPQLGTPSYAQGWAPAVGWTDRGQVDQMSQTCVPVECYEDVLVIAETSQSEPDAQQLKYYARGVGNVRVGWRGGGEKTKETLELVKLEQLSPEALAEARAEALKLEQHAYEISKDVYAHTPPAAGP